MTPRFFSTAVLLLASHVTSSSFLTTTPSSTHQMNLVQRAPRSLPVEKDGQGLASELKLVSFEEGYNVHEHPRPDEEDEPLSVMFQINLRNLLEVNEVSQICSLETTIRIYWRDK